MANVTVLEAHDDAVDHAWSTLHRIMLWVNANDGDLVVKRDLLAGIEMSEAEWDYTVEMVRPLGE